VVFDAKRAVFALGAISVSEESATVIHILLHISMLLLVVGFACFAGL
jgi:hypothetical protein